MKLAPIGICTYSRLDHLEKTITALKNNVLAEESALFVYSDAPRPGDEKKVQSLRHYLKKLDGFKSVSVIERQENGRIANCRGGILELLEQFGKVIWMEDDIVTAPGFLKFMNQALEVYEDREDILNIVGYRPPLEDKLDCGSDAFLFQRYLGWGSGTWLDKFKKVLSIDSDQFSELMTKSSSKEYILENCGSLTYEDLVSELIKKTDHYDVRATLHHITNDSYTVYPRKSLVNNIGHDGTGVNCGITNKFIGSLWSKSSRFNLEGGVKKDFKYIAPMAKFFSYHNSISQCIIDEMATLINQSDCKTFSIWGTGYFTEQVLKKLIKSRYEALNLFIDSWAGLGDMFHNKPVLRLEDAIKAGEKHIFILSIASRQYMKEIIESKYKYVKSYIYNPIITTEVTKNIGIQLKDKKLKEVSIWGIENVSDAFLQNAVLSQMQIDYYIDSDAVLGQQFRGRKY